MNRPRERLRQEYLKKDESWRGFSFIFPEILIRHTAPGPLALMGALWPSQAFAHASEGGFVLLLPTDVYVSAGVASVVLTIVLLAFLPAQVTLALFRPLLLVRKLQLSLRHLTSCLSALVLWFLLWRGSVGPHDPLVNPLPLFVWTVWWVVMVALQGLLGNHWCWSNPWIGPAAAFQRLTGARAPWRYPRALGHWPALILFLCFAGFLLADPAPADPKRLTLLVGLYWHVALLGLVLFGPAWMVRGEAITVLMRAYARIGILGRARGHLGVGLFGWQALKKPAPPLTLAIFMLLLLGTGSFDGLNETFWWMGVIGVNPLEFPGRSSVVIQNLIGLILANCTLLAVFAACLWLGDHISGSQRRLPASFRLFAPAILPIALGYHLAHYLTSLLVDGQYVLKALNDPLQSGADLLGLGDFHVTTGFLNTPQTVKAIWLSQAGAVVGGHVIAILLSHALALRAGDTSRRALLGQAPLAAFMVGYTFFGLWLLASPRSL